MVRIPGGLAAGFLLISIFPLKAGGQESDAGSRFFALGDSNGDGMLSEAEYGKVALGHSHAEVAGEDGELHEEEYVAALEKNVLESPSGLDFLDDDGDGWVSEAEYASSRMEESFAEIDLTGDGRLEAAELGRVLALQSARADAARAGGGGGVSNAGTGGGPEPEIFKADSRPYPADVENTPDLQAVEERALVVPAQLVGKALLGPDGRMVGQVESVVMAKDGDEYFVVSEAAAYGIEGRAAIAVKDLQEHEDGLQLREGAEARAYEAARFLAVEGLR